MEEQQQQGSYLEDATSGIKCYKEHLVVNTMCIPFVKCTINPLHFCIPVLQSSLQK